ncbi:glycosyltransferase family 4 protein [Pseudopelagicola sp. nBUS_20]|uniref:glycosyltransferase family 4 protein n=1 Tax=Pseudopelagicola sp. nBUS_20 TaxID=3395317 RepID=UPI003EB91091
MSKRIWFLTQFFDPEPTFKGAKFARAIIDAGFEVEVITGFPNYPGGKLYPGYKVKLLKKEILNGVKVNRVALYPSHDRNAIRRAFNYLSFCLSSFIFLWFRSKRNDMVYVYHPPITVGLAAALVRKLGGPRYIIDVQDLWPNTLASTGMVENQLALKIIGILSRFVYRNAHKVVAQSHGFKVELLKMGVEQRQLQTIYNWCDESYQVVSDTVTRLQLEWHGHFVMVYCGNLGLAQDLQNVLEAVALLRKRVVNFKFIVVGSGVEKEGLVKRADELGLDNVAFLGRKSRSEIPSILAAADYALVSLKSDPLFEITLPSKMQEYMFAGKPIVAVGGAELCKMVKVSGAGIAIGPGDPRGLCEALTGLLQMDDRGLQRYSKAGCEYYEENFAFKVGVKKFCQLFDS